MTDKMMRNAGRGDDGTAKAIQTDNDGLQRINLTRERKTPDKSLVFKKTNLGTPLLAICKGFDGYFYVSRGHNQSIEKYKDITSDEPPVEISTTKWDYHSYGEPLKIIVLPEGITIVTNGSDAGSNKQTHIYFLETINSDPQLVYQAPVSDGTMFSVREFGIKSYHNGMNGMILVGVYGRGQSKKDLLLSKNGGQSFEVIKTTRNIDSSGNYNSHWHDVDFDVYNGLIWASEGDGPINRALSFSDDLGKTWQTVGEGTSQPTAVVSFPDIVVLGKDSGFAGLDYLKKPKSADSYDEYDNIQPLKKLKPNINSINHYGQSTIKNGNEGYMSFNIDGDEQPEIIVGTGNGGYDWYVVNMSYKEKPNDLALWDMGEKYVYAINSSNETFYAEKPAWQ